MTPEEARRIAKQQNDDDHAAGRLPSRYVEDEGVLLQVARLVADADDEPEQEGAA